MEDQPNKETDMSIPSDPEDIASLKCPPSTKHSFSVKKKMGIAFGNKFKTMLAAEKDKEVPVPELPEPEPQKSYAINADPIEKEVDDAPEPDVEKPTSDAVTVPEKEEKKKPEKPEMVSINTLFKYSPPSHKAGFFLGGLFSLLNGAC